MSVGLHVLLSLPSLLWEGLSQELRAWLQECTLIQTRGLVKSVINVGQQGSTHSTKVFGEIKAKASSPTPNSEKILTSGHGQAETTTGLPKCLQQIWNHSLVRNINVKWERTIR